MEYKVASSLTNVMDGWCTVYRQYLAASLIGPNEVSLFTFPQYIGNNTAVILGQKNNKTMATVSGVLDSNRGLPLDGKFRKELKAMRKEGKKLMEIGLFASKATDDSITTKYNDLIDLMSAAARFGVKSGHHDIVLGVHPKRVQFFAAVFGCKPVSEETSYDTLNSAPVILMHTNGMDPETNKLPAWQKIYNDDLGLNFEDRYLFNPHNFISPFEFDLSIRNLIGKIWNKPVTLQAA